MSQLSSPLPSAPQTPVAFPPVQSAVPDATLPASNQVNATSFVEQLAKLLQTLTPQAEQVEVQAATVADQSATPATAASKPVEADAATPATAAAQPQVSAPETLVIATALHAPGAPSIRPRDTGSGKGKVEPARRASSISSQSGAPAVSLALSPDTAAAVQSAALATPNAEPRHNSALHRVGDQADSGVVAGAPSAASSPPWKPDELKPAVGEPQPSEAAPMHLTPINLDTNALPTTSAADSCQPATQPARSAEPQTAASSTGQQTSPAAQITPALMHLGHAPDGAQRLTVRLDPPDLGHVQVKIDRPLDAPARVEITVEKPETLSMLLRDQPQLQRALDQAGVPVEGRNVTFHVATPEPASRSDSGTAPVPNTTAGGLTGDGSHGAARQHTQSGRRQHDATDDGGAELTPIQASGWMRAGLDITA